MGSSESGNRAASRDREKLESAKSSLAAGLGGRERHASWATHFALIVVQIAFASQAVEAKLAMLPPALGGEGIAPEAVAMVRMIGGALFFQAAAFSLRWARPDDPFVLRAKAEPRRIRAKTHVKLAIFAALGVVINQALFLTGLKSSTPVVVSLLGATIPVFAAGLSVLFRKEEASARTGIGIVLALAGVLWLTGIGSIHTDGAGTDRGAVLVALNCLSYAAYVVFSRDTVIEVGSLRLITWVFTYGALLFAPMGLRPLLETIPHLSTRAFWLLAYIVLVPTILAYGLNAWALARTSASIVTIYIYVQPVIAALLARLQLGHSISSRAGLAAVLIFLGVLITTVRPRRGFSPPRDP